MTTEWVQDREFGYNLMTGFQFGLEGTDMLSSESSKHFSRWAFSTSVCPLFKKKKMSLYKKKFIQTKGFQWCVLTWDINLKSQDFYAQGFSFNDTSTSVNDTGNKKRKQCYFPFYHWCYWISLGTKFSDDKITAPGSGLMPYLTSPGTKKTLWAVFWVSQYYKKYFCTYPSISNNPEQRGNIWFSTTDRMYFNLET